MEHHELDAHGFREPVLRDAGDLARLHRASALFYSKLDPETFQVPPEQALVEFFEGLLKKNRAEDTLWRVAVDQSVVIGSVMAHIRRPVPSSHVQLERVLAESVLVVDALEVDPSHQRSGYGRRLMAIAESWGRDQGSTTAMLETFARSPLSIPFYERGLGYKRHAIIFEKHL